jgi:hypothetical protein
MVEVLFPREHTTSARTLSMRLACVGFLGQPGRKSGRQRHVMWMLRCEPSGDGFYI